MRFVRFGPSGSELPGFLSGDSIIDLSHHFHDLGPDTLHLLADLPGDLDRGHRYSLGDVRLGPPISRPNKIVGIGLNYADHAAEAGVPTPEEPVIFFKATTSFSGPYDDIHLPPAAEKVDWEVELGVVIGATAQYLSDTNASEAVIAGYAIVHDVSERAWQLERSGQWVKGKSADTFSPTGPFLVTHDELADAFPLEMKCRVNGITRQHGSTSSMIFDVPHIVWYLSQFMTLEPGDLILTGTPPGVGMATGEYLHEGDVVELEIAGLGMQRQVCRMSSDPGRVGDG
ncbi:MAG: fumarylacetoacetate hydrolase family protein [Actinomycetota bacterium]